MKLPDQIRLLALQASHHVRHHVSRTEAIDADSKRRKFDGKGSNQTSYGFLGGDVCADVLGRGRDVGCYGGDEEDASTTIIIAVDGSSRSSRSWIIVVVTFLHSCNHARSAGLGDEIGSLEIDIKRPIYIFLAGGEKGFVGDYTCSIHVDIDAAKIALNQCNGRCHGGLGADVAGVVFDFHVVMMLCLEALHGFGGARADIENGNVAICSREYLGEGEAESAGCSSDDGCLALEIELSCLLGGSLIVLIEVESLTKSIVAPISLM